MAQTPHKPSAPKLPIPGEPTPRGNIYGTGLLGAVDHFIARFGTAAAHELVVRTTPPWRSWVKPNAPSIGILGARKYPYAFAGELIHNMSLVVKAPNEDAFIRELTAAGMDLTLNTVARVVLRLAISPRAIAERAQELWGHFHDSGRVTILSSTEGEYVAQMSEWPNHDVTICKVCMEARRRLIERTGQKVVEARREKCQAWGHDVCVYRIRWAK